LVCHRTYVWKIPSNRVLHQQHWFKLWITESCSIKLLCKLSGYSKFKITGIKNYWLEQTPSEKLDYEKVNYAVFDATYFHKDGCLMNLMDATNQKIIASIYVQKESFKDAYPWFLHLKYQGFNPRFITTDGEQSILRAMKLVWPQARLQRCLYHIQHEGMRWLRTYPKTEAGKVLRTILSKLSSIKTSAERDEFIFQFQSWIHKYKNDVLSLPRTQVAFKDLNRTMVLINNALSDMFYFLEDPKIHPTTNALEGFHSRLKADYQRHRGLSKKHKLRYFKWYCYFENTN
jgi:hypothetical protein